MGVDVTILFESLNPVHSDSEEFEFERPLPDDYEIRWLGPPLPEKYRLNGPKGSTHEIHTLERFYGENYERGSWPRICSVLMLLHACPTIGKVWYGGDCTDIDRLSECPSSRVLELSAHFMKYGERPYREELPLDRIRTKWYTTDELIKLYGEEDDTGTN